MRIFVFIFTLYILFLAIEPGIESIFTGSTKTECCNSCKPVSEDNSSPEKKSDNKNNTGNTACNPFQNCQACIGYTITLSFISNKAVPIFIELQTPRAEKIPTSVYLDFWHPPKLS
jgi:hypothetical protein